MVIVSVLPAVVVTKTVCPLVVDNMSLEFILVRVGEFWVVEALTGDGDVGVCVGLLSSEKVVVEESSSVEFELSSEDVVVDELSSSPPPGPLLSSSVLLIFRRAIGIFDREKLEERRGQEGNLVNLYWCSKNK